MKKKCALCGKEFTCKFDGAKYCSVNCRVLFLYYKHRDKKIAYQREYDKEHKEKKREYDKKRRETTNKNKLRIIQNYSKKNHFTRLLNIYKGCQICGSKNRLEIHHKKYTKKISDCLLLCQPCHKKLHRKFNNFSSFSYL